MNFELHSNNLSDSISQTKQDSFKTSGFFVKVDISGIQDFIFNVQSKGAAKTLKAKSFFIQALADILQELFIDTFKLSTKDILYNGGGNLNIFIANTTEQEIDKVKEQIETLFVYEEIYVVVAYAYFDANKEAFAQVWERLHKEKNPASKLNKFSSVSNFNMIFSPFEVSQSTTNLQEVWKSMTDQIKDADGYQIKKQATNKLQIEIYEAAIRLINYSFEFNATAKQNSKPFANQMLNQFPLYTNHLELTYKEHLDKNKDKDPDLYKNGIIPFEYLTQFAGLRTGTEKLAVLKLDVDNLGVIFKDKSLQQIKEISAAFSFFFEVHLKTLLAKPFQHKLFQKNESGKMITQNKQAIFKDHIYPVFAGGDDCFLVGAWDAVVEFGYLIYNEFKKFSKCKITLSCGIILVGSGFPVIRFAHLAEDALKEAKSYNQNGKTKNAVSLFGEVISWEDFEKVIAVKNILLQLIELGESRGVLDRIRQSGKGYFSIQEAAKRGYVSHDRIWRFNYYLRNIKTPEGKILINNQLIPLYQKYLLNAITQKQYTDAAIFPLAARWAELLTRQITTKS